MKKISYILCLTFIFSLFAISPVSYAENNLNAEVTQHIGAEFLEVMNISDPVKDKASDYNVTRAEAITTFVNLFGYNASGEASVPFTDAKGELTGILRYALDLGMISESDSFRPNDAITYNEAFKMCTVVLGYDYLAKLYGGWPAGYVRAAGECNLSDGLPASDVTISKEGFYLFVENLLTAEMLEVDGMVDDEIAYRKHTTVLETYFGLYEIEGVVTANAHTGLYSLEDTAEDMSVFIDDYEYSYKGDSNRIGRNVTAYADDDKIAVMVPTGNKTISVAFNDIISAEGNLIYYDMGNKEAKIRTESVPAFLHNGKCVDTGKVSDYKGKNGYFTFVDNDDDNVYEVCEANEYRNLVVFGVNAIEGYITDKNGEKRVDLSDEDCTYFVYENGVEKTLADISAGSLLSCYESNDGLLCTIVIEKQTVNGILTGFSQGSDKIVIDDISYPYGAYFKKHFLSKVKSGQEITAYLSSDGVVQCCDDIEKEKFLFGYFLDVKKGKGMDTNINVKFVSEDGAITVCSVDKKLTYNGTTYSKQEEISDVFFDATGNKKLTEQVIRYKLSGEGKLTLIDTVASEKGYISSDDDSKDNLKEFAYPTTDTSLVPDHIWMSKASGIVHPWYAVTGDTFIIQVNSDTSVAEEKRFAVRDLAWIKANNNWTRSKCTVYNVDEYLTAGALVLDTVAEDSVNDDSKSGIVCSVTKALDDEGVEAYKIVIFTGDYYNDYFISDAETAQKLLFNEEGELKVGSGDQVRFSANTIGQIAALEVDYDCDKKLLLKKNTNPMYLCYFYGGVYTMGNGMMTLIRATDDGKGLDTEFNKYAFVIPGKFYIYDSKTGQITTTGSEEIETYLQAADECTRVLVKTNDLNMVSCTIYR